MSNKLSLSLSFPLVSTDIFVVSGHLSLDGTKIVAIALVYVLCLVVNSRIAKMTKLKLHTVHV